MTSGGEIVMGWLRFIKIYFHGFGTCLVVRTLRGKSLMLHASPFMDLSRLDCNLGVSSNICGYFYFLYIADPYSITTKEEEE